MNCPKCASRTLKVEMAFTGRVSCAFTEGDEFEVIDRVALDSEWDDSSACECPQCSWRGTLGAARSRTPSRQSPKPAGRPAAMAIMSADELRTMRQQLQTGYCNPIWRAHLERLIEEVERLNAILDTITRVYAQENRGRRQGTESDTLIS